MPLEPREPPLFEPRVVGIVNRIDTEDIFSLLEQQLRDPRADEAGAAEASNRKMALAIAKIRDIADNDDDLRGEELPDNCLGLALKLESAVNRVTGIASSDEELRETSLAM